MCKADDVLVYMVVDYSFILVHFVADDSPVLVCILADDSPVLVHTVLQMIALNQFVWKQMKALN